MTGIYLGLVTAIAVLGANKPLEGAEMEVRKLLDDQMAAWNKGDLDGFMAGYWNSPELTFYSGGTVTKGWQPTMDRYRKRYGSDAKSMGTLAFKDLQIEVIGLQAALVRGRYELIRDGKKDTGLFTLLVKRFPKGWYVVHDHTSG